MNIWTWKAKELGMGDLTTDTFFNGRLIVKQPRTGYRYSIDAAILASHVQPRPTDRVLDLGTGCGIIPLIIGFRHPGVKLYGVEIQHDLAEIAQGNITANNLENRVVILPVDMKTLKPSSLLDPMDLVVSNPPFYRIASGRINSDSQRAIARHELKVTLEDVLKAAAGMLRTAGKFVCIYGSDRLVDLFAQMRVCHIEPKIVRLIHSKVGTDARLVLVEGVKGGSSGLIVKAPLFIYCCDGVYTDEIEGIFAPEQ
jgi:tRNA1Val (adenine37-N6)-methyltransferase